MKTSFYLAASGLLSLTMLTAVLFAPSTLNAQSPGQELHRGQTDMWNPSWMQRDMWRRGRMGPGMRQRMDRHWTFMQQGVPTTYQGARNPFAPDSKTIHEGQDFYQENCASCHGVSGLGDGEAANSLNPSPALLAYMIQMPMSVDEYMLWSISEGGESFGTEMPAFKDVLTQEEIWKIITYMRGGFPIEQQQ